MKNYKAILAALLLGACPAAWAHSLTARAPTTWRTPTSPRPIANSTAVTASPTNPTRNVYLALTRLLALPTNDATATAFLNRLGISASGRDIYHWQAEPKKNSNGGLVVSNGLNADQFTAEIRNDIVPELVASETNLAQITDPSFTLFMPGSVTHFADVTIDYGDVQVMRAILDALPGFWLHDSYRESERAVWDGLQHCGQTDNPLKTS